MTDGGRCEQHQRQVRAESDARRGHSVKKYNRRAWRDRTRPAKIARNPLCEDCEERGLIVAATDVDHIDGDETNDADENLRALCHSCHSSKTARTTRFGRG